MIALRPASSRAQHEHRAGGLTSDTLRNTRVSRPQDPSVGTLILMGGTAIDIAFLDRYAVNAQRALDQLAGLCASDPGCRKTFTGWERQFGELVKAWNDHPANGMTGNELASVVQAMLLDLQKAVWIPRSSAEQRRATTSPSSTRAREVSTRT